MRRSFPFLVPLNSLILSDLQCIAAASGSRAKSKRSETDLSIRPAYANTNEQHINYVQAIDILFKRNLIIKMCTLIGIIAE